MYKLQEYGVQRISDSASIPESQGNTDWQEYQKWLSEGNTPEPQFTEEELAQQAAIKYQSDRIKAYATIGDQLDMQYHDAVDGTTTWQDHIALVKNNYPKPSGD